MMKKTLIAILLFFIIGKTNSQNYLSADTIRRHEISVSVLPVINFVSGAIRASTLTNFNFGYKYYFKNNYVLRTALVLFPKGFNSPYGAGLVFYHSTVGNKNIFYTQNVNGTIKSQLNIGIEKIYRYNRLIHGVGLDAFINQVKATYQTRYFYRYFNQNFITTLNDTMNYSVDSLGYKHQENKVGVGVQIFYSLKYKISKRWYISATVGPSFNFSFVNVERYEARTKETLKYKAKQFDFPNVGFISDISICFRL